MFQGYLSQLLLTHRVRMSDSSFKPPDSAGKRLLPVLNYYDPDGHIVREAVCPHCGCYGCVRVSSFTRNAVAHLHWHCPCCRHVWVERDRRRVAGRASN